MYEQLSDNGKSVAIEFVDQQGQELGDEFDKLADREKARVLEFAADMNQFQGKDSLKNHIPEDR